MSDETSTGDAPPKKRNGWLEFGLIISLVALVVQLTPDISRAWREWPWAGCQTPGRVVIETEQGGSWEIPYLVYLPQDYSSRDRWPLLLYLHGSGERGSDLERLRRSGPPAMVDGGKHLPLIVISPQCRQDGYWESEQLLALLDKIEKRFSVDPERIYVAGFSMGGWGAWSLANAAPERFAALVPIAGSADGVQPEKLLRLPIWAFHGTNDPAVPHPSAETAVQKIRDLGGVAKMTLYKNRGHGICGPTFARDDLWQWLLEQRK